MALKKVITAEEHKTLSETVQPLYMPSGDGFALDIEGGLDDVAGLKSALEKERKAARDAAARLKKLEGVDPDKYQELLTAQEKAEQDRAIKAGEFDSLKKQLLESNEKEKNKLTEALLAKESMIYNLMVSSQFSKSPLILEKTLLPPDIAETYFSKNFKVEEINGRPCVVGYLNGEKILDTKNGEPADFEAALTVIIDAYPMKDRIMKGGHAGSGATGNSGAGNTAVTGDPYKMTATQKADFIEKQGLEAYKALVDQYVINRK